MKQIRPYPRLVITKKGTNWVQDGHPWIYEGEVIRTEDPDGTPCDPPKNGSICDAVSENGRYLGSGFLSLKSKIRLRIISTNANDRFDEAFFRRRVRYAIDYRKTVMGDDFSACRLIYGESDGFPGLTVDRFNDLLSCEVLSLGMELRKDLVYRLLKEELEKDGVRIRGLYERNESRIRELEGLPTGKGWFDFGDGKDPGSPVTQIVENGIVYDVDVENGQKTGFFLDQKYNRLAVAKIARGKTVLDCFTHTGSFALNAALHGAAFVTAVDISKNAVAMAEENARKNHLEEKMEFIAADVFGLLPRLIEEKKHPYDLIILDPPAFTKSRKTAENASRGYKEINLRAMQLLNRGGYLATASCSHFMSHEMFEKMLKSAARDAGVSLKQVEVRQQAPDHPILWNVPETDYLKFYIFQII